MTKRTKKPSNVVVLPELQPAPVAVVVEPPAPVDVEFALNELYSRFQVLKEAGKVDELIVVIGEIRKLGGIVPESVVVE